MKFGVNTWVWVSPPDTAALERFIPQIAAMGFDLVEVPIEDTSLIDYARVGALARDNGLAVSVCAAMGADRDLIHPDEGIRRSGDAYLRHAIEATKQMGGTNLVGPLYATVGRVWQSTPDERARDLDVLVPALQSLAAYAADHNVTLCVEALNRFETSFLNLTSQVIEVVDRVGHPNCALMLDTFHMNIEEPSLGAAIRAAGPRLKHVHVCENDRGTPGSGHVAWDEVAVALAEIGYDGPCVIESFTDKVKSIARAAAIWRPLAPSQDALAQDGLTFLRGKLGLGAAAAEVVP